MHQSLTRQLGYLVIGVVLALAMTVGFARLVRADTAPSTGTTTNSYVFDASMTGANQVPPVSATTSMGTTTGHARIWFDMTSASGSATTTTNMWQSLEIWNGDDITAAHLHCGTAGQNGPVVLDMFHPSASSTDVNGTLVATSTVSVSDLHATTTGCSMPIMNLTDLANAMKAGIIYANAHSVAYPSGVARGQLTLTSQMSTSSTSGCTLGGNGNASSGWYDGNHVWHSCDGNGGNGGHMCNTGTATSTNGWNGWFDNTGTWHSCAGNGGNGGNNCVGAASTSLGWYDANGHWHACAGGNGGTGNCAATSTTGWYDQNGNWHSCGNGGNNGNGTCTNSNSQGWYDNGGNWHWCNPNGHGNGGNGGGTSTPGLPGLGSGINGLLSKIFGQVNHILETFLPTDADVPALRTIRTR